MCCTFVLFPPNVETLNVSVSSTGSCNSSAKSLVIKDLCAPSSNKMAAFECMFSELTAVMAVFSSTPELECCVDEWKMAAFGQKALLQVLMGMPAAL